MSRRGPITPAASPCRCCGTRRRTRSSITNRPKSSACSIRPSTERRRGGRLLSERPSAGDRRGQRAHLSNGQQRRLSRRFRDHAGSLRRGVPGAVRDARLARGAAQGPALPDRPAADRSRLAPVHDPHSLRRRLFRPLQVQFEGDPGLPGAEPLSKRALPLAGRRRDGRLLPHQASLLREPPAHQSDRHRAPWP